MAAFSLRDRPCEDAIHARRANAAGRPAVSGAGERLRDPTLTACGSPGTRALLRAVCEQRRVPTWLMLRQMVVCFVRDLPPRERRWVIRRTRAA